MNAYKSFEMILGMNMGIVDEGVFRGRQPSEEELQRLKEYFGVNTIINLSDSDEREMVEKAGLKYFWFPSNVLHPLSIEKMGEVVDITCNNKVVYGHCREGIDRTGYWAAAYQIKVLGWQLYEAEECMQRFIRSWFGELWVPIRHRLKEFADAEGETVKK